MHFLPMGQTSTYHHPLYTCLYVPHHQFNTILEYIDFIITERVVIARMHVMDVIILPGNEAGVF